MYGDRFGSPGRDDRQDGSEHRHAQWEVPLPPHQAPSEDVKVAGAPLVEQPPQQDLTGATTAMPTAGAPETDEYDPGETTRHDLPVTPQDDFEPRYGTEVLGGDDFAAMRRKPRSPQKTLKVGVIAAAAVVVLGGGTAGAFALTGGSSGSAAPKTQTQADAQAPAPLTDAQRKEIENRRRKELKKRASRAARQDRTRPMLYAKGTPIPTKKPSDAPGGAGDPVPAGEAQKIARAMLPSYGWSPSSQFGCLVNLWNKESRWNVHAANPSGAYGIPQALPGSKMASAGPDWQNNARTQIKWGLGYIKDRYGSPCAAWSHSQSTGWY